MNNNDILKRLADAAFELTGAARCTDLLKLDKAIVECGKMVAIADRALQEDAK